MLLKDECEHAAMRNASLSLPWCFSYFVVASKAIQDSSVRKLRLAQERAGKRFAFRNFADKSTLSFYSIKICLGCHFVFSLLINSVPFQESDQEISSCKKSPQLRSRNGCHSC